MTTKKLLKYLFIPGLILISAGLTIRLTVTSLVPLSTGLLIGGGIILIIWLIFILLTAQGFWQKRSTQVGTNAILSTLSVLAILGIINFLAVRYSTKIDLTENQIYTLSSQSQEIVKNLKEPVKVWIFDNEPSPTDKELLENYHRYNTNFQYEYVDPDQKPGLVKQIGAKALGDVYLQYKDKKQQIQTLIAFGAREPLSEIKLTNGIEKILRDRTLTVYFLQGHGEHSLEGTEGGLSEAVTSLREKGYRVEPLNLAQRGSIPPDADVIVIAGPKKDLFKQEVETLQNYTAQGGNLFILLDPTVNAGLTPLLQQWGVKLDDRIVIDGSGAGQSVGLGPATPLITTYGNHPITKDFNNEMSFYPLARAIDTVKTKGVEANSLLITSNQMWAESDLTSDPNQITFNKTQDIPGPFDLGVALTRIFSSTTETNPSLSPTPTPGVTPSPTTNPSLSPTPTPGVTPSPTPGVTSSPTTNSSPSPTPGVTSSPTTNPSPSPTRTSRVTPSPTPTSQQRGIQVQLSPKSSPSQVTDKQQTKQTQKPSRELVDPTDQTPFPDLQNPQTSSPGSSPPSNLINPEQEILDPTSTKSPTASPSPSGSSSVSPSPSPSPLVSPSGSPSVSPSPSPLVSPSGSPSVLPSPIPAVSPSPTPTLPPINTKDIKPGKPIEAKMVVIGNSTFPTNGLFEQQLNGDVFLNSVQWLASGDEQPLSIRPREPENRRIVLSKLQASSIFWLSIIVFPLLGFLTAGVIWWRRR